MIKIPNNTEFSGAGWVWIFLEINNVVTLKKLRPFDGKEYKNPTLDEVKAFFIKKGYSEEAATKFYEYYSDEEGGQWRDGKGNLVKDWHKKAKSVWFRDEHKIKESSKAESKESKFLF